MDEPRPAKTAAGEASPDAKLTIKVGKKTIHLEARPEIVRQELERLVDRLFPVAAEPDPVARDPVAGDPVVVSVTAPGGAAGVPPTVADAPAPAQEGGAEPRPAALDFIVEARGRQMIQPGAEKLLEHVTLDPGELAGLFAVDASGRVLLKALPHTVDQLRDTVLLLLYGALTMRGESSENGYRLVQGVRGMGLRIERVPRELGPGGELATSFGRHRSKRYRLTAGGIRHCEKLIPGLLRALGG